MSTDTPTAEPRHELIGHTSPDTAYLVLDYPYGFQLRTEIRYLDRNQKGPRATGHEPDQEPETRRPPVEYAERLDVQRRQGTLSRSGHRTRGNRERHEL